MPCGGGAAFLASRKLQGSSQCSTELAAPQLIAGPVAGQFSAGRLFVKLHFVFSKEIKIGVEIVNPYRAFTRGLALWEARLILKRWWWVNF